MAKASVKQKPGPTVSEVQASLDRLVAERDAGSAEYLRLEGEREIVLLDGTDDDLRRHDEAMAAAKVRSERASLKHDRMLPDLDLAREAEEQARRREVYEAAKKKRADGLAAIDEYEDAASRLSKIARRIVAGNLAVNEANRELPEGSKPLDPPEPFNGTPATPVEYVDEVVLVAFDKKTGQEVNGYDPSDPKIGYRERKTGKQTIVCMPSSGRPHQSFLYGLRIPSRDPEKPLF